MVFFCLQEGTILNLDINEIFEVKTTTDYVTKNKQKIPTYLLVIRMKEYDKEHPNKYRTSLDKHTFYYSDKDQRDKDFNMFKKRLVED